MNLSLISSAFTTAREYKDSIQSTEEFYSRNIIKHSFKTHDGYQICAEQLIVQNPLINLVIIPGRGEIGHKYADFLLTLYRLNISATIVFARGQGGSDRLLCDRQRYHIDRFSSYAKDIELILGRLQIKDYVLLAFSLGGLIAMDIIKNHSFKPKKAALIAPYIWPYYKLPSWLLKTVVMTAGSVPFLKTRYTPYGRAYRRIPFDNNRHSHCPERYCAYHDYYAAHPDQSSGSPTYQFVKECMKMQLGLLYGKYDIKVPLYVQSCGEDKVVDSKTASAFFQRHAHDSGGVRFEIIDGAYHDIINESDEFRIKSLSKALEFLL